MTDSLSSSLLKSVLTDLYTESKERDWQWQLNIRNKIQTENDSLLFTPEVRTDLTCTQNPRREIDNKYYEKYTDIEDLF